MTPPAYIRRLSALLLATGLGLTAGCGDDGGGDDGGGDDGGDGFADQSGKEISDAAKKDMLELESMRYDGSITSNGEQVDLDVQTSTDGACTGSLAFKGGTVELLAADGGTWYRPDEDFWRANAPDQADAVIAAVGDKWVVDTEGDFTQFCDLTEFLDQIFDEDGDSTYSVKGTSEIDGEEVVEVESEDDDGTATGYVLVEGDHYIVKIERAEGDSPGSLAFGDFDEPVTAEAPAEDEQIDLSTLG